MPAPHIKNEPASHTMCAARVSCIVSLKGFWYLCCVLRTRKVHMRTTRVPNTLLGETTTHMQLWHIDLHLFELSCYFASEIFVHLKNFRTTLSNAALLVLRLSILLILFVSNALWDSRWCPGHSFSGKSLHPSPGWQMFQRKSHLIVYTALIFRLFIFYFTSIF